jgi:hypothetical protein
VKVLKYRRWKRLRRFYTIEPFEDAFVPYGANKRTFAVRKEGEAMRRELPKPDVLEGAVTALQSVLSVLKADGTLDDAAKLKLGEQLDSVADAILPPLEITEGTNGDRSLPQVLKDLVQSLKEAVPEAQSADMSLADRTEAILADAELASAMAAELGEPAKPEPTEPPAGDPPTADPPAADPTPTDPPASADPAPAPTDPPAADPPQADPAPAPPVQAADPEPPTADPEPPQGDPPAADPPPPADDLDPRYATKADLQAMTQAMTEELKKMLKPVEEVKSALQGLPQPGTQPTYREPEPEPKPDGSYIEQFDMAQSPDLKNIDEYGQFKE